MKSESQLKVSKGRVMMGVMSVALLGSIVMLVLSQAGKVIWVWLAIVFACGWGIAFYRYLLHKISNELIGLIWDFDAGQLEKLLDENRYGGLLRQIAGQINQLLTLSEAKRAWYEAIIDAAPFPLHVTDNDLKWTFMNRAFEKLLVEQGSIKDRQSSYGRPCSTAAANICNTANCGIKQLHQGKNESFFEWCGMSCKQDTAYLTNAKGEHIGFVEVVTDLTPLIRANEYTKAELSRVEANLKRLARNDFNLDLQVGAADEHTVEIKEQFDQIKNSFGLVKELLEDIQKVIVLVSQGDTGMLERLRKVGKRSESDQLTPAGVRLMESVQGLINEAQSLENAALSGNLSERGNSAQFEGGFRRIIAGFNNTLNTMLEPIQEADTVLHELAQGNLQVKMTGTYRGGHAALKEAMNTAVESFSTVLGEINTTAAQVAAGSSQVSQSSQTLSHGATEQAATMEEITASVTQIADQTKTNAEHAGQANQLALSAKEQAIKGNDRMQEMVRAMGAINESSASISKIIKVIDEIAFQTNILALNAAVEAARAGQYGKGFAVVAEEVRNLAARSANAAKETTALIEGSINKVESGTKIANETAAALNQIVTGVSQTVDLVGEIAVASNDQATGIAQINQGIAQVSQVTQSNTATVEESAAASEELTTQAYRLQEMVGRFKSGTVLELNSIADPVAPKDEVTGKQSQAPNRPAIVLEHQDFGKY
ncbi:MAG: methyl-accepting chemotaxis protein [Bacillota bacterium]